MNATLETNAYDGLLRQQLSPYLQGFGLVIRNTFIDFQKPVISGARQRAHSEGATPIIRVSKYGTGCHTPILWDNVEQSRQVTIPTHFAVDDDLAMYCDRGVRARTSYCLGYTTLGYPSHNPLIHSMKPGLTCGLGAGYRTPSLWDGEEESMEAYESISSMHSDVDYDASFIYPFDRSTLVTNVLTPYWETDSIEQTEQPSICDGTCAGCYWNTKNNSCQWGDQCKFCHQCKWVRRTVGYRLVMT